MNNKTKPIVFGVIAGIIAAILALSGNPGNMAMCIACFIRDTAGAMNMHSAAAVQYVRPEITGLVLGALIAALATKEFRSTAGSAPATRFVLGFITMIGALVFLGCPLRMVLRMSAGDLNAYVGLIGFIAGIATGAFFLRKGFSLGRSYLAKQSDGFILPAILVLVFILSVTTTLFVASTEGPGSLHAAVAVSLLCGVVFGIVAQRSRMCFAGGIRDVILMKDPTILIPVGCLFAVMLIFNIATGHFNLSFEGQAIAHTEHLWNILGMYIVGFAAVMAGGCPLRQLILAGTGSSDSSMTVLGMFVGAGFVHNFGLASSGKGTTPAGRVAVIACIITLFVIALVNCRKEK